MPQTPPSDGAVLQVGQTLSLLDGGVTSLSPDAAAGVVSRWIETIGRSGRDDLAGSVGGTLGELRDALAARPLDGRRIGLLLTGLARQTRDSAGDADDIVRQRLGTLASALDRVGRALGSPSPDVSLPATDTTVQATSTAKTTGQADQGDTPAPPSGDALRVGSSPGRTD